MTVTVTIELTGEFLVENIDKLKYTVVNHKTGETFLFNSNQT